MKKILAAGLGGGLDIVNASLLYFAAVNDGIDAVLGSIRPAPLNRLTNHRQFADCGSWVSAESHIDYGRGIGIARYCEPKIAKALGKDVLFLTRKYEDKNDVNRLNDAIKKAKEQNGFDSLFFVDGGGDSLTFTIADAAGATENLEDPFVGGDSIALEAMVDIKDAYLAVISVGLDISESGFQKNVQLLRERDAYFGRVNLKTREKDNYQIGDILSFNNEFLQPYFQLAESIVAINNEPEKAKSHTGVVTYHALKGNFGIQRTYVPWEPTTEGKQGVLVKPEHCWMYFFDASKIHQLKLELNRKI